DLAGAVVDLELVGVGGVRGGDVPLDNGRLAGCRLRPEPLLHLPEDLTQHRSDAELTNLLVDLVVGLPLDQLAEDVLIHRGVSHGGKLPRTLSHGCGNICSCQERRPSCMPTSTPSTRRSSSGTTRRCWAVP